jgi:hypothetical protein
MDKRHICQEVSTHKILNTQENRHLTLYRAEEILQLEFHKTRILAGKEQIQKFKEKHRLQKSIILLINPRLLDKQVQLLEANP